MSRLMPMLLALSVFAAGCASAPNPVTAPAFAATDGIVEPESAEPAVNIVTEEELLVATDEEIADAEVVCRLMLQAASNQLVQRCMSRQAWRTYERAQELWAQQMLRQMQGSPYR
jgi:hypothetical protein